MSNCIKSNAEYTQRKHLYRSPMFVYCTNCDWHSDIPNAYLPTKKAAEELFRAHINDLDTAQPTDIQKAITNLRAVGLI